MNNPKKQNLSTFKRMRPEGDYENVLRARELDGMKFAREFHSQFVEVLCPSCHEKGLPIFDKYGFSHKQCPACKTIYCSPRPTEALLSIYYTTYNAPKKWTRLLLKADAHRKILQYKPRIEMVVNWIRAIRNAAEVDLALDLGCGSGAFAACLKKNGYFKRVQGLDLSEDCVKATQQMGVDASIGTIDNIAPESVDTIFINDLIEHLYDPHAFLKAAHHKMRPGGFLSIATPNGEGFDFKIMKDKTRNITPPEHLNYFNPNSITRLLNSNAFRVCKLETPGKLDTQIIANERAHGWNLVTHNEYLEFLFSQDEAVLTSFQDFLVLNRLSSHMLVLAQKI